MKNIRVFVKPKPQIVGGSLRKRRPIQDPSYVFFKIFLLGKAHKNLSRFLTGCESINIFPLNHYFLPATIIIGQPDNFQIVDKWENSFFSLRDDTLAGMIKKS